MTAVLFRIELRWFEFPVFIELYVQCGCVVLRNSVTVRIDSRCNTKRRGDRSFLPGKTKETALATSDQRNAIVCAFTYSSPRITSHQILDWIYDTVELSESYVRMIQIDGPRRHVYIKFYTNDQTYSVLQQLMDV
jgi:hypothetical protein